MTRRLSLLKARRADLPKVLEVDFAEEFGEPKDFFLRGLFDRVYIQRRVI